jgi:hypothetical protein
MDMSFVLKFVLSLGIGAVVCFATLYLLDFLKRRRDMKLSLRRRRDAMVADLVGRLLQDQRNLQNQSLDARKNLIRISLNFRQAMDKAEGADCDLRRRQDHHRK